MLSAFTTAVPNNLVPSLIVTTAPGIPVPLSVGLLSLVLDPATTSPTMDPTLSTTLVIARVFVAVKAGVFVAPPTVAVTILAPTRLTTLVFVLVFVFTITGVLIAMIVLS